MVYLAEKTIDTIDVGLSNYRKVYSLQKELVRKRQLREITDTLIIAEHSPVFTIGRRGSKENLLRNVDELKTLGIEVIDVDRGGDITFHGPGQLVLYPILDLTETEKDIHLYIRNLEEVIVNFLSRYNVTGFQIPGATGIWTDKDTKIGSIGIGVSKWVTYHGLSINVNTPLYYFDMINPCGLKGCKMASLASILKTYITLDEAKRVLIECFKKTFNYE